MNSRHGDAEERGDDERFGRRDDALVDHVLRAEQDDEGHEAGEAGVDVQDPVRETGAAGAEEVVAGEDGERRHGGKDVAGKLRHREGEEDHGKKRPEAEELGERVAGADVAEVALGLVADLPLVDGEGHAVEQRAQGEGGPGEQADDEDDGVVEPVLRVLVAVGGEALEVVFEEEDAEEVRVLALDLDVPGQDHEEEEREPREPEAAADGLPLAAEAEEEHDGAEHQEDGDGALGEGGGGAEEVEIEQPELFAGLIPGVPAEQAYGQRSGELHVRRRTTGKAHHSGHGNHDERGVEMAAGTESSEVKEGEDDERAAAGGGG